MIKAIYNLWLRLTSDGRQKISLNQNVLSPSEDVSIKDYYSGTTTQESTYIYPDTWIKPE